VSDGKGRGQETNLGPLTSAPLARLMVVGAELLLLLLLISSLLHSVEVFRLKAKRHILGSKGAKGMGGLR
jgi:hypothetical protein